MPILKPISGHGATGGIRRYLEKGGRALARDLFNLSYDERDAGALGDEAKEACAWDAEMDATRAAFGTDAPWRGKPARTFKHFVLSPDPGDDIDLAALRELACSWALKHFGDHEIAIVYHDDNARGRIAFGKTAGTIVGDSRGCDCRRTAGNYSWQAYTRYHESSFGRGGIASFYSPAS